MPAGPDPTLMFQAVRAWADTVYPDHLGVEIVVRVPGRKPARLVVPAHAQHPNAAAPAPVWRHDAAYRDVFWHGHRFKFSKSQAAVVELLDLARRDGNPEIDQGAILRQIGSEANRLLELFRRGDGNRAWGLLVVPGDTPGSYRLADRPPDILPDSA